MCPNRGEFNKHVQLYSTAVSQLYSCTQLCPYRGESTCPMTCPPIDMYTAVIINSTYFNRVSAKNDTIIGPTFRPPAVRFFAEHAH